MSHFTVTVRLSATRLAQHKGDVESAVRELLAPFEESPKDGSPFIKFKDCEDEYREEYETGTTERVRTPQGELLTPWDDRFRVKGSIGIGGGSHQIPDDCTRMDVPLREVYKTFAAFATDYHGSKRDPETGRFGYHHNPDAKWDWWTIGGRWSGYFPVKPGRALNLGKPGAFDNKPEPGKSDVVRVEEIDMDLVAKETREKAEEFWTKWEAFLADPRAKDNDSPFGGPRSKALDIGLLNVVRGPATSTETTKAIPWDYPGARFDAKDERRGWTDVARLITRDEFLREYVDCFTPIASYAALDEGGWHASGEMGWWGSSSDKPDDKVAFKRSFVRRFIKESAPTDTLVVVDCHI